MTNDIVHALEAFLALVMGIMVIYAARHFIFSFSRLFGRQRHPYVDVDTVDWPAITVLVAAHNEQSVIEDCLRALLEVDYPADKMLIMPVNDRSTDDTRAIIDRVAATAQGRIQAFHRQGGKPGKAAALKEATTLVRTDLMLVFDADYLPGQGLIKQLVAPFFDPEVGAVMGRVVPLNGSRNFLTQILELERAGGYQVDQQARMNLGLVPQYGGTVGGVRVSALESAGGWHDDVLAEDTDLTYRLLLNGWSTAYTNRSECYEEVPEEWAVRRRQIIRWARGHNQALARHFWSTLRAPGLPWLVRADALLLLGVYAVPVLMLAAWAASLLVFMFGAEPLAGGTVLALALMSFGSLGNFAAFFEIGVACLLDGQTRRIRLLPLNIAGFLVSMVAISDGFCSQVLAALGRPRELKWDKTARYRTQRET